MTLLATCLSAYERVRAIESEEEFRSLDRGRADRRDRRVTEGGIEKGFWYGKAVGSRCSRYAT